MYATQAAEKLKPAKIQAWTGFKNHDLCDPARLYQLSSRANWELIRLSVTDYVCKYGLRPKSYGPPRPRSYPGRGSFKPMSLQNSTVYIRIANLSRGRGSGTGGVTLASATTFLHINDLVRLTSNQENSRRGESHA